MSATPRTDAVLPPGEDVRLWDHTDADYMALVNLARTLERERDNLYRACQFYANGAHYTLDDWEAPDEPNWICPPLEVEGEEPQRGPWSPDNPPPKKVTIAFSPGWMVEDGGIARFALEGGNVPDLEDDDADCEMLKLHEGAKPLEPPLGVGGSV